jgi:hypothetical protein
MGDRWTDHVLQDFPTSVVPGVIDFPDFLFLVSVDRIPGPSAIEAPRMIEPGPLPSMNQDLNDRVPGGQRLQTIVTIGMLAIFVAQRPEISLF